MKMLSATQQTQEEIERTKHQLAFEVERVRQESDMKVSVRTCLSSLELKQHPKTDCNMLSCCFSLKNRGLIWIS